MKSLLRQFKNKLLNRSNQGIEEYEAPKNLDAREDIERKYNFSGALLNIFVANKDNVVHKWHHYIPLYDKYFGNFRNRQVRFLEI